MNYSYQGIRVLGDGDIEMSKKGTTTVGDERGTVEALTLNGKILRAILAILFLGTTGAIVARMISTRSSLLPVTKPSTSDTSSFDQGGRYVMRNFDDMKPCSNFLAGLGGLWGVPMVRIKLYA
jgi:hypothetical protein